MSEPKPTYTPLPLYAIGPTPPDTCTDCGRPLEGQGYPAPSGWVVCPACMAEYTDPPAMELGRPGNAIARIIEAVADKLTAAKEAA